MTDRQTDRQRQRQKRSCRECKRRRQEFTLTSSFAGSDDPKGNPVGHHGMVELGHQVGQAVRGGDGLNVRSHHAGCVAQDGLERKGQHERLTLSAPCDL